MSSQACPLSTKYLYISNQGFFSAPPVVAALHSRVVEVLSPNKPRLWRPGLNAGKHMRYHLGFECDWSIIVPLRFSSCLRCRCKTGRQIANQLWTKSKMHTAVSAAPPVEDIVLRSRLIRRMQPCSSLNFRTAAATYTRNAWDIYQCYQGFTNDEYGRWRGTPSFLKPLPFSRQCDRGYA